MATQVSQSMISETSICNQALSWLGHERISRLEEPSQAAEWCRDNYAFLRDTVLEERMWTFATVRATSTTAEESAFGQLYVHPKPLGWMKVFRVYGSDRRVIDQQWRMESDRILSQYDSVDLWGIQRVTDTGKFSNLFVQALAARIAADLAIPLTENARLQEDMWALYQKKLEDAAARDGQQGGNDFVTESSLVNVRVSGGIYRG